MKSKNKAIVKRYFNRYFKAQYFNEQDHEFKSLVRILNKKDKQEHSLNWISVKDRLPEDDKGLVVEPKNELTPRMTKKLLVITNGGSIFDNRRLKMQVGEKQWKWFIDFDGEEVTHWALFTAPNEKKNENKTNKQETGE